MIKYISVPSHSASAGLCKNFSTDFIETCWKGEVQAKEETVNFSLSLTLQNSLFWSWWMNMGLLRALVSNCWVTVIGTNAAWLDLSNEARRTRVRAQELRLMKVSSMRKDKVGSRPPAAGEQHRNMRNTSEWKWNRIMMEIHVSTDESKTQVSEHASPTSGETMSKSTVFLWLLL